MKLDPRQYDEMVSRASPPSPVVRDCAWAFLVGGAICTLGEALRQFFLIWYDKTLAGTLTSIALIFLSAIFTLPGWYQKRAAKAGAGTLVPITGFANSVVSPNALPPACPALQYLSHTTMLTYSISPALTAFFALTCIVPIL